MELIDLKCNGFVIQRNTKTNYKGIEGDNWYLNYCSNNQYFREFYEQNIDRAWDNEEYVDCCTSYEYVKKYIEESVKMGIDFKVLLCSTCKKKPILDKVRIGQNERILGYDYAYSGGSYYSSILNDILSKRIKEFEKFQLNENGLFNSYEEVAGFSLYRKKLKEATSRYDFEEGDFVIYKITEIYIN